MFFTEFEQKWKKEKKVGFIILVNMRLLHFAAMITLFLLGYC